MGVSYLLAVLHDSLQFQMVAQYPDNREQQTAGYWASSSAVRTILKDPAHWTEPLLIHKILDRMQVFSGVGGL